MRKGGRILVLLAGLGIILGIGIRTRAEENISSSGALQFQGPEGIVQARSQDTALLQDKVWGISEEVFDPAYYSRAGKE